MPSCEVCGTTIRGSPLLVELEGAIVEACPSCARLGTPASRPPRRGTSVKPKGPKLVVPALEFEVRPDYSIAVKEARERLGLSQEELGRRMSEKTSVVSLIERGRLKPSDALAKRLEHVLKITLLVPGEGS